MALTFTEINRGVAGNRRVIVGSLAFDSSYPTGGEDLAASLLGMIAIDHLSIEHSGAETVVYDRATNKLQIFIADGTEAVAASDQSAISARVMARGT